MAPTQISLVTELSRDKLLELRDEIDALIGASAGPPGSEAPTAQADGRTVEEMARRLRGRAGADLQAFIKALVKQYPTGSFTWEDAAAALRQKLETVKSWHRSVSKPLNRLAREFPGAPPLMSGSWDGKRNHYTLNPQWVAAIEKTWT